MLKVYLLLLYGYSFVPASFAEEALLLVLFFIISLSPWTSRLEAVGVTNGLHLLISNLSLFPSFPSQRHT